MKEEVKVTINKILNEAGKISELLNELRTTGTASNKNQVNAVTAGDYLISYVNNIDNAESIIDGAPSVFCNVVLQCLSTHIEQFDRYLFALHRSAFAWDKMDEARDEAQALRYYRNVLYEQVRG